ncbi:hypothetical protein [Tropicimonas sp. S265A]|uniref:hypothetical protein n=1 Tax=Tropicimonas sp. S265A TaxID=3415134 RepID=UPI003C7D1864
MSDRFQKLKEILGAVAPTVATALGGPLAGLATKAVAEKLTGNPDASEEDLVAAISSGEDLIKLKELELEFKTQLQNAGIKLEEIAAEDRDSARRREVETGDRTPAILGAVILAGFFGVLGLLFFQGLPEAGGEIVVGVIGILGGLCAQVGNYFFGSSAGSKSKNAIIADLKGKVAA